jgi:hypothetical protein
MPQDLICPPPVDLETPAGIILKKLASTKPPSADFNAWSSLVLALSNSPWCPDY